MLLSAVFRQRGAHYHNAFIFDTLPTGLTRRLPRQAFLTRQGGGCLVCRLGIYRERLRWWCRYKQKSDTVQISTGTSAFQNKSAETPAHKELGATVVAVFTLGLGPAPLTVAVWRDDRHWLFLPPVGPWRPGLPVQPQLCST